MTDALALLAVLAPAAGGFVAWFAPRRVATAVAGLAAALSLGAALALAVATFAAAGTPQVGTAGVVRVDALGAWLLVTVAAVAVLALCLSPRYVAAERRGGHFADGDVSRYYALLLWMLAGLVVVPLLDNLGLVWVALEATTAVSALLVGFHRTPAALEASWKYLILGSVGIGFALLGTVLTYASSVPALGETSDALNWSHLMANAGRLDPGLLRLAFLFVLAGYGTKIGLVPFHTWLPDAHSQAPSPVSALLSGVTLVLALSVLMRFNLVAQAALGPSFSAPLLVGFGLLSLAVALPFLVAQGDLKRLLAYSSVEHMGLLTLAIGFGSQLALVGATLHILAHALTKSTAFLTAGDVVQQYGSHRLGRIRSVASLSPVSGPGLVLAALLAAGLPPSAVFVAEFAILLGGIQAGWTLATVAAALLLAGGFAAVAFHVLPLGWGRARRNLVPARPGLGQAALVMAPLLAVIVLGLWTPEPLTQALNAVVAVLAGGRG